MADIRSATSGDQPQKRPTKKPAVPGASAFKGVSPGEFIRDAWTEVYKKTTWPTSQELIKSTSVVLATIVAVSLYLAFWDLLLTEVTRVLFAR